MRVGLDVTPLVGPLTGVGVFTRRLVDGLVEVEGLELAGLAFTARGRGELGETLPSQVQLGRLLPARVARAAWLRVNWPTASHLAGPLDLVHGTNFVVPPGGGVRELVTIHDFGPWTTPELVATDALDFPPLVERAVRRGAHVHVVSDYVATVAAAELGLDADRIHKVGLGVDPPDQAAQLSERLADAIGGRPFVLAVGSIVPRKNFGDLVRALGELSADHRDLMLVIAGSDDIGSEQLSELVADLKLDDRVIRTGFVTDEDKAALLRKAEVVVSSALHEGFGLVPLEAMSVGTPVVAAAGGSIPEVCGDAAHLVDPGDVASLAAGIDRVLADAAFADRLVAAGRERAGRYSWASTVHEMVQLYERLTG